MSKKESNLKLLKSSVKLELVNEELIDSFIKDLKDNIKQQGETETDLQPIKKLIMVMVREDSEMFFISTSCTKNINTLEGVGIMKIALDEF